MGICGHVLETFGFPMVRLVPDLVLGPIIAVNLRTGLLANDLEPKDFITCPMNGLLILATLFAVGRAFWLNKRPK